MRPVLLSVLLSALFPLVSLAQAQAPAIDLELASLNKGKAMVASISPATSAAGCSYALFGATRRRALESLKGGRLLGTFPAAPYLTQIKGANIRALKSSRPRARRAVLYTRARVTCGAATALSDIETVAIPSRARGARSTSAWIRQLGARLTASSFTVQTAFPNLAFPGLTDLQNAGDGSNRLFAVQQEGLIQVFENTPGATAAAVFLNIADRLVFSGERGLLGLAFHPNYEKNGFFYVHYSSAARGGDSVISRFQVSAANPNQADPASELLILPVDQDFDNHNGGQIAFGPDGFLYVGLGDAGAGGEAQLNGQNRATLPGSILRIDVGNPEGGRNYGIPSDNPFVGNTSGFRQEIYAYGFRNPWRLSFDDVTKNLWVADVGEKTWEEIDLVKKGGNYGWNVMEGTDCYLAASCATGGLELPVFQYPWDGGGSVTGGYVYRGIATPALTGLYIFGDFINGGIWGLRYENSQATLVPLADTELNVTTFGRDEAGEVYIGDYQGTIHVFSETPG